MPKKSRASSRIFSSTSSDPSFAGEFLDAGPRHGRTNSGMFASLRFGGGGPATGNWLAGRVRRRHAGHHRGERAPAAPLGAPRSRLGPDPDAERLHDLCLVRIGQHRHLVAALRTRVDDRERAALGRTDRLQLHRAVAGDAEELHRGGSLSERRRFEAVQKLLRNMVQGPANGCFGQVRERDPRSQCRASSGSKGRSRGRGFQARAASGRVRRAA